MACNLHTCNCLLVLMIGWLFMELLIKAVVNLNVFKLFRLTDTVAATTSYSMSPLAAPLEGLI